MLAKPLYETIPYGYLFFGGFCLILSNSVIPTLIGVWFYLMGANIWRMRSLARRKDHKINRKNSHKHAYYYEFKPFILFLAGLLLATRLNETLSIVIGVIACFVALLVLALRVLNRRAHLLV